MLDAGFVLEMLDRFFGGPGVAPGAIPNEFSATAEMMAARVVRQLAAPLTIAWEPLVRLGFEAGNVEVNPAMLADLDADDAMVVTRFGIAAGDGEHRRLDLVYPVAALKPHTLSLTGKVHTKSAEPEPEWRTGITRAVMTVKFPVRSVLAQPLIPPAR